MQRFSFSMILPLIVLLLLNALALARARAERCELTVRTTTGPAYNPYRSLDGKPNNTICDSNINQHEYLLIGSNPYYRRRIDMDTRITVSGRVMDENCDAIPGAKIDVWQTTSEGRYPTLYDTPLRDECRGISIADKDGEYAFHTVLPGAYGILFGMMPIDCGPFGPAHFHVMVYAPGYETLVTQLLFDNDFNVAHKGFDFRVLFAPAEELSHPSLILNYHSTDAGNAAVFDFVLRKIDDSASPEYQVSQLPIDQQLEKNYCKLDFDLGQPLMLCNFDKMKHFNLMFIITGILGSVQLAILIAFAYSLFVFLKPKAATPMKKHKKI